MTSTLVRNGSSRPEDQEEVRVVYERITPLRALDLKLSSLINRKQDEGKVREYAKDMLEGQWGFCDSMICIDRGGRLINGQHRLEAIVRTSRPQWFHVAYGIDPEAIYHIDTGKPRSAANILQITGHSNASKLATLCRSIYCYETRGNFDTSHSIKLSARQMEAIIKQWGEDVLLDALKASNPCFNRFGYSAGAWAYLYMLFGIISEYDRDNFFEALTSGAGLEAGHPVLVLRELLDRKKMLVKHQGERFNQAAAWTIKAWNKFRRNEPVVDSRSLKFRSDEAFPVAC